MNYKELKKLLIKANEAYYKNANPILSDFEFDSKLKELESIEKEQGYRDSDSPTIKPGSDLFTKNNENTHQRPMLSLENTYNEDEISKWYEDMQLATGESNPEVVVNPKWDGCSGAFRFGTSGLYKALTRGSGIVGEDMTANIKYCNENVWPTKSYNGYPFLGEVRGEVIMTKSGFDGLNATGNYQNARNLVSGTLKLLNIYDFIPRANAIKFYAYWLEESENTKYSDDLIMLSLYKFEVGPYYVCHSISEIKEAISKIETTEFDVAIDGAVMKLNNKSYWKTIGSTSKFPRWAKAYKYKQESVETTINKIEFWVGRTGKITPVAWFKSVLLDGSTIQKATLNNKDFYESMNVAIGDIVEVQKAAAIIPQIVSVSYRPENRKIVKFPKVCPSCGSKLSKHNEDHADWYCDNSDCKSRIVDQIINYTHTLEIDGFAEIVVERLYNAGLLNSILDLYSLKDHKNEIAKLDRMSINIAEKLCNNIESSKTVEFWKILSGLGIPNVGPKTAKILSRKFKSIKVLEKLTIEELTEVEDIAKITATGINEYFKTHKQFIQDLILAGVVMEELTNEKSEKPKINLNGKTLCITGALSLKRETYIELIEACGGKVVSGVNKKTSYLITNNKFSGSSKNLAAQKLGIPILNENELLEMCDSLHLLNNKGIKNE